MQVLRMVLILTFVFFNTAAEFEYRDEGMEPAQAFFLQKGDPEAGKKAFSDLRCFSCHSVENAADLPAPVSENPGPVLGKKQADYASGWLANSIVSPSHTIALDSDGSGDDGLSRMGDFTEAMTVRQMMDLVAYLKSAGGKAQETGE